MNTNPSVQDSVQKFAPYRNIQMALLLPFFFRYALNRKKKNANNRPRRQNVHYFLLKGKKITFRTPNETRFNQHTMCFIIFINDLQSALPDNSMTALYADDTKLFSSILSYLNAVNLQQALTNFLESSQ